MPNPTIFRYPRVIYSNPNGTVTEEQKSLRQNGDISTVVKIKNQKGHVLVVWHHVHDSKGTLVHGPHEEPGSRDPNYTGYMTGPPKVV